MGRVQGQIAVVHGSGQGNRPSDCAAPGRGGRCGRAGRHRRRRARAHGRRHRGGRWRGHHRNRRRHRRGPGRRPHRGRAVERFGRLDILVNNVGGNRTAKIWDLKVERLGLRPAPQPAQHLPLHPRRRAAHDAAEERAHRLHLLGRPRGHAVDRVLPGRLRVLRGQGGHPRLRPRRGARAGRARHQRERRRAGPPSTPSGRAPI